MFRSQACRAGRNILGYDLHLNTCVSFLTEDINEDIRICSTAANFTGKNSDHVFVDCKERGRSPDTLITQRFNTKHNSTNQFRLRWCYLESMSEWIHWPSPPQEEQNPQAELWYCIFAAQGKRNRSLSSWPSHWRLKQMRRRCRFWCWYMDTTWIRTYAPALIFENKSQIQSQPSARA